MSRRRKNLPNAEAKGVIFTPAMSTGAWEFRPASTNFNYAKEVGDGLGSSVLVALLCWLMRTFPEAPTIVERRVKEQWRTVLDHPMAKLIEYPNEYYSGDTLWKATVMDFAFGNAYWIKIRDGFGKVKELWWAPAALMRPIYGPQWPNTFVHHYEYRGNIDGQMLTLLPQDVVHFRFGLHPLNTRLGYTPLAAMVREIYTDDQASNFTASVLRNLGIIGILVSPKPGESLAQPAVDALSDKLQSTVTGDQRGKGIVLGRPVEAQVLQYNLQGFDTGPIRDIAEERLSATMGIPAAVVGFGTGLQSTKVGATMRELVQLAWTQCILPMQKGLSCELNRSLLTEFQTNTGVFRTNFDTSEVRALREDEQQRSDRMVKLVSGGIASVAEARQELGLEVRPEHEIYYRPTNITPVKTPDEEPEPVQPPQPPDIQPPDGEQNNGQPAAA